MTSLGAQELDRIGLSEQSPLWLRLFAEIYQNLRTDNLCSLARVYHPNVVFEDPLHKINGYEDLSLYFDSLYKNLVSCEFKIEHVIEQPEQAAIYWRMLYQHPKLNQGNVIEVQGHSHIKGFDDKVMFHRDYVDMGAMLYEHLPIIGKLTRWVKQRAVK